jgi:phage terminase large subunit GpA-like protein
MALIAPLKTASSVRRAVSVVVRAPRRVKPSDAAAAVLKTEKGPWRPDLTPYLLEPLDHLGGREYRSVIFVGPARTGKTMSLILGGIAYVVTCAPGDMLVVQMSEKAARDFSKLDLDRAIRHSPEIAAKLSPRARDDNVFDKFFRSGIVLKLGWPAVSQLSSKTLQYVFLTDYDRPENVHNVDGEGPMFDLASKRTETYMSRGKTVAESSPGEDYTDAKYVRRGNEAPPARGILSLYNAGTRARWHWPCQHCGELFEAQPGLGCFAMPEFDELVELVKRSDLMSLADQYAKVMCIHCGAGHEPNQRSAMNAGGRWLHEGESIVDGQIVGERRRSNSASYWLGGVAAAYQTWPSIVHAYLAAVLTYARTGDEGPLKKTTNTDQGAPYLPRAAAARRGADHLMQRLVHWDRGTCPAGVRFVTAAVDVQAHRFRVNFFGWGEGLQSWLIDRVEITRSRRPEGDGFAGLEPGAYVEDWSVLVDEVLERTFTAEGTDEPLKALLVGCDSGGREGVTVNAYEFWRRLSPEYRRRFRLLKGVGNLNAPRVVEAWPDAKGKQRGAGKGDVPVLMLNVNLIKDGIYGDLTREVPGPGYVHLPDWVPEAYFDEITSEIRTPKGWEKDDSHQANEDFDLHAYNRAMVVVAGAEKIDWSKPPEWALLSEQRMALRAARAEQLKRQAGIDRPPARNWVTQW